MAASAIGSRASEKEDLDELTEEEGRGDDGTVEVVEDSISSENWPSSTDCLRAWGWLEAKGRASVRAREGTSGDFGAAIKFN